MLLLNFLTHLLNMLFSFNMFYSHKKRNVSLEGSLDRVLVAVELEFSKTSVPKLPKNISNATSECAGKIFQYISKWPEAFELLHTLFLRYA